MTLLLAARQCRASVPPLVRGGAVPFVDAHARPHIHQQAQQQPRQPSATCCRTTTAGQSFSSVSKSEVDKFSSLHAEWWDPEKNPLIHMNPIRVQYIRQQVAATLRRQPQINDENDFTTAKLPFAGLNMLDIGCGGGLLSESLARLGAKQVTGIDPSAELLQVAQQRAKTFFSSNDNKNNLVRPPNYHCTTAEEWCREHEGEYDVVCILDVVEHIPQLDSLLEALSRLPKKQGGLLFLSTMNRTALSYALTILGAEYAMGYVPVGTHDWNGYKSPQEIQALLAPHSFASIHVSGMVLQKPPLWTTSWDWKLDPNNTCVNWIGTYQLQQ